MPIITSKRLGTPVKIYFEVHGKEGGQAIIFHHGNGNASRDWGPLGYLEKLASQYKLVLIDMLGYGNSEKATDPKAYDPQLRAMDTIAVLDELGLKDNIIFFGGSMGGQLGFTLALNPKYHHRFSMFIITCATPYGTAELSPQFVKLLTPAKQRGICYFVEELEKAMGKPFHPFIKTTFLLNNVDAMIASNTIAWPDYSKSLHLIKTPFLLIVGEKDPIYNQVCACHKSLSNSTLEIIAGKDHVDTYWDSSVSVPLIIKYLNSLTSIDAKSDEKSRTKKKETTNVKKIDAPSAEEVSASLNNAIRGKKASPNHTKNHNIDPLNPSLKLNCNVL